MAAMYPGPPSRETLLRLLTLGRARTRDDYLILGRLSEALRNRPGFEGANWSESDTAELNALLTEYGSLRQESLNTINNRVQILVLGLAAIGAVAGVAATSEHILGNRTMIWAIFSAAIPFVCIFVFLVWLSEAIRNHRVGYHLAAEVEARINAKLERLVVTWEASLWTGLHKRDEMWGPSMAALGLVFLVGAAAPWCGLCRSAATSRAGARAAVGLVAAPLSRRRQLIIIAAVLVALSLLFLGVNIFIFGRKFPETEVGKNKDMIRLGLRCPHCEERLRYRKINPIKINFKTLQPDWSTLKG